MAYTNRELRMSVLSGLSLMARGDEWQWATFDEIEQLRKEEWYLVNDQKRLFHRSYRLKQAKKGKR